MAQSYTWPSQSVTATNPSVSINGTPIPGQSTLVAGENPSGNQQPLQTDASGNLLVSSSSTLPPGAATSANQTTEISHLTNIETSNAAIQTSTASIDSKIVHVDTGNVTVVSSTLPTGAATSANQTNKTQYTRITDGTNDASVSAANALKTDSSAVTQPISAASLPLPAGATTEATISSRLTGALVPTAYDEIDLTYIVAGPGTGQIGTAVYKLATVTVKTLTLTYDGSDRLSSVVAS